MVRGDGAQCTTATPPDGDETGAFSECRQHLPSLTGAVGVDREALVNVVLDEQERLLEDLSSTGLLHSVGVARIPEKRQQFSRGTRLTGGMRGIKKEGIMGERIY